MTDEPAEVTVLDRTAWRAWLDQHHTEPETIWLTLAKSGTTEPTSLTYAEALEEALCYGWIDSQAGRGDAATYRQRFSPRRARSRWSKRNIGIIALLNARGCMQPAGIAEVERAKADGRWDAAYAGPASTEMPSDLSAALSANPRAAEMFEILTSQNRYAIIYRINDAKRADTRARRIEASVNMLARGETFYPQKRVLGQ